MMVIQNMERETLDVEMGMHTAQKSVNLLKRLVTS